MGHTAGWLPQDAEIRLPTSLEWERAARHTDQRRYPWGDTEPTPEHANYAETGIGNHLQDASDRIIKNGSLHNGNPTYLSKACRYQFVEDSQDRRILMKYKP